MVTPCSSFRRESTSVISLPGSVPELLIRRSWVRDPPRSSAHRPDTLRQHARGDPRSSREPSRPATLLP